LRAAVRGLAVLDPGVQARLLAAMSALPELTTGSGAPAANRRPVNRVFAKTGSRDRMAAPQYAREHHLS
jgi:hypothetical protein